MAETIAPQIKYFPDTDSSEPTIKYFEGLPALPAIKITDPGDIAGQVVDESGKGLYAGFFDLDADGKQITNDYFTDQEGRYHTTYPQWNPDKIFIQFYSTEEFEPVVLRYPDLKTNPKVVLKRKVISNTGGLDLDLNTTLSLVGIGIALISLRKKNSVGATYIQRIKAQPRETKLLAIGAGAIALYFLFKYKPTPEQKSYLNQARSMLDYLAREFGIVPSLTLANFTSLAMQIKQAVDGCATDEGSIYRAFEALNNEADIYQLITTFGITKYLGCTDDAGFWSRYTHKTLTEAIASDLTSREVQNVNSILGTKGISFAF